MQDTIDWPIISAAMATFISTVWLAFKGWKDAKSSPAPVGEAKVVAAAIQDTAAIRNNTRAVEENTAAVCQLIEQARRVEAAQTRLADMILLIAQRS